MMHAIIETPRHSPAFFSLSFTAPFSVHFISLIFLSFGSMSPVAYYVRSIWTRSFCLFPARKKKQKAKGIRTGDPTWDHSYFLCSSLPSTTYLCFWACNTCKSTSLHNSTPHSLSLLYLLFTSYLKVPFFSFFLVRLPFLLFFFSLGPWGFMWLLCMYMSRLSPLFIGSTL